MIGNSAEIGLRHRATWARYFVAVFWGVLFAPALHALSLIRAPYLQLGTPTSIVVRWRTDVAAGTQLRFGATPTELTEVRGDATPKTEHEVRLTGLLPDTKYYYAVGDGTTTLATGENTFFVTSPLAAKPTRVWLLGDPGTGDVNAQAVRDAYYAFTGARHTDLWMMNGDNAYDRGTDGEYTAKLFRIYSAMARKSVLWAAYGNHDAVSADATTETGPYFAQHTFPRAGEAGGLPSGTEAYYAFDYGNIHFVFLDTSESSCAADSAQVSWLKTDLAANTKDWTIVVFHHPPYTQGTENSDNFPTMIRVRQVIAPIMDAHGVDLVVGGHAHYYQRSFLISGHYGSSTTFDPATMVVQPGDGRVEGDGAYLKDLDDPAFSGTIYLVAGSSGKLGPEVPGIPVMQTALRVFGSVVLDFDGLRLDVRYVDRDGAVLDEFTIQKIGTSNDPPPSPVENEAPSIAFISPRDNSSTIAPVALTFEVEASDSDGVVERVEFIADVGTLGSDTEAPYSFSWDNVPPGTHTVTARAVDDQGGRTLARPVRFVVEPAPVPGLAVTGFTLIDAQSNRAVPGYEMIEAAAEIPRASLPTAGLSIRVNTTPAVVGSVRIGWDGNANFRTESEAPYALFGGPGEDYYAGTIANGTHTITGTPFTEAGGAGGAGSRLSVTFSITNDTPPPPPPPAGGEVVGFSLIDADKAAVVPGFENIADGANILRSALPTSRLSMRVNTNPAIVGSVKIGWDGNAAYRIESQAPYALFGGPGETYYAGTIADGIHTISGTPFELSGAKGSVGVAKSVTFTIAQDTTVEPAPITVMGFTLMNADTDQPVAGYEDIVDGTVIPRSALPTPRLSVRVNTSPATVGSVRIGWNANANYRTESTAPYELFGGPVGDTYGGAIPDGTHTIRGTPFTEAGGKGAVGTSATVTFTIE